MALEIVGNVVAAIPSPPWNVVPLGPLSLRAYGAVIALGAILGIRVAQRRWIADGGSAETITRIATVAIPAGLIGARAYHVATDWHRFDTEPWRAMAIWQGGLGIPGGIAAGAAAGAWIAHRDGLPVARLLDVAAPAIPVAQAIGRLGNWFNQELYGRPTDLPWALRIDVAHRPDGLEHIATYHPTFLYEGLWNVGLAGSLVWVSYRWQHRPGQLFLGYLAGYALGRLIVETIRIDPATTIAGLRVNIWVSATTLVVAVAAIAIRSRTAPTYSDKAPGVVS